MVEVSEIPGIKKAAILLLTVEEEVSKEVLKGLDREEIEALGDEISKLQMIPEEIVSRVHDEFLRKLSGRSKHVVAGEKKFRSLVEKSLGADKADRLMENMAAKKGMPGEFIRSADPRVLANVVRGEHPQTIALVLSILSVKKACELVTHLPDKMRVEVITRMASLEKVDKRVLEDVEQVLKEELESLGNAEGRQLGGVELVATILNQMDRTLESQLLEKIEDATPELAEKIKQLMFTFEDLMEIDDKGIQILLKEISSEELSLALKGASDQIKTKIFSNMSERAAAMLKEDLEAMGPARASDVEKAQMSIAMVGKRLDAEGKIIISRGDEKFV